MIQISLWVWILLIRGLAVSMRKLLVLNYGTVYSMEWSLGVESWSGVLEWSIGVKWTQILEWKMDWSCLAGQQTLTQSLSFDLPICFIIFYDENSMNICHSKIWVHSTPIIHSKIWLHSTPKSDKTGIWLPFWPQLARPRISLTLFWLYHLFCYILWWKERELSTPKCHSTPSLHSIEYTEL